MKDSFLMFRHLKALQQRNSSQVLFQGRSRFLQRSVHTPADDPNFLSIVDNPPQLVKVGKSNRPGLIFLGYFTDFMATIVH